MEQDDEHDGDAHQLAAITAHVGQFDLLHLLLNNQVLVFTDGQRGLQAAYGDDLLRLVVVEAAIARHLDIGEYVGVRQLGHEDGVLADHQRTGA